MNRRPDDLGRKLCRDSRRWTDFEGKRLLLHREAFLWRFFITAASDSHFKQDSSSRGAILVEILHRGGPQLTDRPFGKLRNFSGVSSLFRRRLKSTRGCTMQVVLKLASLLAAFAKALHFRPSPRGCCASCTLCHVVAACLAEKDGVGRVPEAEVWELGGHVRWQHHPKFRGS